MYASMLFTLRWFILTFCLLLPDVPKATEPYAVLADHGKSQFTIVISPTASEVERFAVEELQKYLDQITGVSLPIKTARGAGKAVLVGEAFAADHRVDGSSLGYDGYIIDVRPEQITLSGVN